MGIRQKIWSFSIIRNLVYLGGATLLVFLFIVFFLRMYTNHGQKLVLPEYVGMNYNDAVNLASQNDFELIIDDSVHIVGKPGGEILTQNPIPGSGVKEGRKIYITITKYNADVFLSAQLPELYGKKYELKHQELSTIFKLECKVIGYKYDPGPIDHILEVQHKNNPIENKKGRNKKVKIARGDQLEFILSKRGGGSAQVPDLLCQTLESAKFLTSSSKLKLGNITKKGEITNIESAYIIDQDPPADGSKLPMGNAINVTVTQEKPADCL